MNCKDARFKISEWIDGDLEAPEISEVESHTSACQHCRQVYDDLKSLRVATFSLPVLEPSENVWTNIQSQLLLEGISRQGKPSIWEKYLSPMVFPRLKPAFGLSIFLLTVILFGSSIYLYRTRDSGPLAVSHEMEAIHRLQDAELQYQKAIQALDEVCKHRIQSMEPRMAQILNDNLATIDYYVKECQDAAHHNPGNPLIQQYLLAAYQKKVELLQSIVNADVL